MSAEGGDRYSRLERNFAVDALTAEVVGAFGCEGIEALVWWSPLAQRGMLDLVGAYLWRSIWVIGQAPSAIYALWRIRRAKGGA